MDPLSAVGLAGTIVQFIHFSCSLVSRTSDIYHSDSGELKCTVELDMIAKDISEFCNKIEQGLVKLNDGSTLPQLALSCKQIAGELTCAIAKVKRKDGCSNGRWQSFRQALKSIMKGDDINKLNNRLQNLRSQIETQLLAVLRNEQAEIKCMLQTLLDNRNITNTNSTQFDQDEEMAEPIQNIFGAVDPINKSSPLQTRPQTHQKTIKALAERIRGQKHIVDADARNRDIEQLLLEISGTPSNSEQDPSWVYNPVGPEKYNHSLCSEVENTPLPDATLSRDRIIQHLLHTTNNLPLDGCDVETTTADNRSFIAGLLDQIKHCATFADILAKEQNILQSLRFDSMEIRESQICQAHSDTFSWILRPEQKRSECSTRVSFLNWLRASDEIYWVAGKPGSGKSTLMKYVLNHPETRTNLQAWAGSDVLVMAGYFFWHRGTELQRSQQGLLQSLLYTIMEALPGLAEEICPFRMTNTAASWTHAELMGVLGALQHTRSSRIKFCFFIDGLDEYLGDHFELVEFLQSLSELPQFKLCLASRPWNCFEDSFGTCVDRRLYLQELTRPDIRTYAQETLARAKEQTISAEETKDFNALIHEVVEKSQGVFLWVALVVRSLREGLANGDTISILEKRVRAFPADLEPFFETLISSVDATYQEIMAKTFLIALETTALPLVTLAFLEEVWDYPVRLQVEPFNHKQIVKLQTKMRRRINGRYKGLLECCQDYNVYGYGNWVAEFLHRTVRDFLQTGPMQMMLLSHVEKNFSADLQLCRILLAQLQTMPVTVGSAVQILDEIIYFARRYERHSGKCDYEMLERLRSTVQDRDDLSIDDDALYLDLLVEKGLVVYVKQYLEHRHDRLLGRTSPWQFFAKYFTIDPTQDPLFVSSVLLPLLGECIEHGAVFSDLMTGHSANAWLQGFVQQITWRKHRIPEASVFLEKLFNYGYRPTECCSKASNASLWSMILAEVKLAACADQVAVGALDVIELCLKNGADCSDPQLMGLIKDCALNQSEKLRLTMMIQGPAIGTSAIKKRKQRPSSILLGKRGRVRKLA